jgi:Uma2 family endonuclease
MTAILHKRVPTLADALANLGDVPLSRVLSEPAPGTATEEDVVRLHNNENRLAELVDGVLVEKPMGFLESRVALMLGHILQSWLDTNDLGIAVGTDGMMRLARGLVRIPDLSVILWERLPGRQIPTEPIPNLSPDLAVEVLSKSNTASEMGRKVGEYFAAGAHSVWLVDPSARTVTVYSSPNDRRVLAGSALVTAETVLPGFQIPVDEIFSRAGLS